MKVKQQLCIFGHSVPRPCSVRKWFHITNRGAKQS